ncbi:hypothetical protein LEP1GSC150_5510 [Leptospira interrogans serovar Copenhageni str. LT2050]|uniref:Uncharacterized protein n=1 Tax=Leptospira interrogans serovar Copenhageni str. LT2050 TaxID=1001598 RepID=M3ISG7_LEPIT|nr:hypothetical protein LEP1GSC150_5510 [Leptospira interrogans serovar Copenhageni str. LT2050]
MKEILGFRDLKVEIGGHFIYFLEKIQKKEFDPFNSWPFGFRNWA